MAHRYYVNMEVEMHGITKLEPFHGWNDRRLGFQVKMHCEGCGGKSNYIYFDKKEAGVGQCEDCERSGTVSAKKIFSPVLRNGETFTILRIETNGLVLDEATPIRFVFSWVGTTVNNENTDLVELNGGRRNLFINGNQIGSVELKPSFMDA